MPAKNVITIQAELNESLPVSINIYDFQGRVVDRWEEISQRQLKVQMPVNDLPNGTYLLKLSDGQDQWTRQFMVVH